jgi:hypothetical protein
LTCIKFDCIKTDRLNFFYRIKNDRIKSDCINFDRIKSDCIKTDRIKSITDSNQSLFTLLELTTKYEANTCVALTNAVPAFGARTFSTVITTSVVQELNEKIAGVNCVMC